VQGSSASYSIVSDGTHTVTWYAIDNAGNAETPPQEMIVNIDKTSPSIPALSANRVILWPNHKKAAVVLGGLVADSGSGIASTVITVTDEYGIYNMTVPGLGSVFQLEAWCKDSDMDGRLYTITAVITDNAGNQSTVTTTVLVPHNRGKGSCKEQEGDKLDHDGDHHNRGHHDRNHRRGHDRDNRRHAADRDARHHGDPR
jgi:hypothetical protein